jgi:peptidoglycan biosynthesis protein MviN/MurJ (putative lipid II flippase)
MVLIWWLREAGLAWSTAITAVLQTVLLARACRRKLLAGPVLDAGTRRAVSGQFMASVGVAVGTGGLLWLWAEPAGWAAGALRTGAAVGVGMLVYGGWAVGRRAPELRWLLGRSVGNNVSKPSF